MAVESNGSTFWVASEGAGSLVGGVSDPSNRPFTSPNLLLQCDLNPAGDGLEIVNAGGDTLAILERDNQGNTDAAVKRVYTIDVGSVTFRTVNETLDVFTKTLQSDILATSVFEDVAVLPYEKLEGMAILSNGDALIVNDNDGVDDSSGETRILGLTGLFD